MSFVSVWLCGGCDHVAATLGANIFKATLTSIVWSHVYGSEGEGGEGGRAANHGDYHHGRHDPLMAASEHHTHQTRHYHRHT